ncbi:hypothetical protein AAur_3490 [Paenarthrobacter aurescens TC1]|jgi:chaperonin cofactor prefoldin|uniref:Uncharacterized protein n=1 Tax=Paenarthrobacter aurescens (strain TC1) TaxID=290340 RepID=A1RAC1_PAEAT|nr:hypothetical protein AAur_3490 [Paenarthrobacter aurescens TC1]
MPPASRETRKEESMIATSNLQLTIEELENLDTPDDTPWYIRVGDVIIIAGIVVGLAAT